MNDYVVAVFALLLLVVLLALGWTLQVALRLRQALHVARSSSVTLSHDTAHTTAVPMNHAHAENVVLHSDEIDEARGRQAEGNRRSNASEGNRVVHEDGEVEAETAHDTADDNSHDSSEDAHTWQRGSMRNLSPVELAGVTIENRVRPRRHLPKGIVVIEHADQHVVIDFNRLPDTLPQAAPPPLTCEELAKLEAAQRRVASPEYYGRAEYLAAAAAAAAAVSRAGSVAGGSVYNRSCGSLMNCSFGFVRGCDVAGHRRNPKHSKSHKHDRRRYSIAKHSHSDNSNSNDCTYSYNRPHHSSCSSSTSSSRNCSSEDGDGGDQSHASSGSRPRRRKHAHLPRPRTHNSHSSHTPDRELNEKEDTSRGNDSGRVCANDDESGVVSDAGSMHGRVRAPRQTQRSPQRDDQSAATHRVDGGRRGVDREATESPARRSRREGMAHNRHSDSESGHAHLVDSGPRSSKDDEGHGGEARHQRALVLQDRHHSPGERRQRHYLAHGSYLDSTSDDFDDNDYINNNSLVNEGMLLSHIAAAAHEQQPQQNGLAHYSGSSNSNKNSTNRDDRHANDNGVSDAASNEGQPSRPSALHAREATSSSHTPHQRDSRNSNYSSASISTPHAFHHQHRGPNAGQDQDNNIDVGRSAQAADVEAEAANTVGAAAGEARPVETAPPSHQPIRPT